MDDAANDEARPLSPATVAVTAGRPARTPGAPVNEPVTLTSTYVADGERAYARIDNPSWEAFETAVGALEDGTAVAFASGMAAVAAALAPVPVGGRVVVPERAYAGTLELLAAEAERGTVVVETVDVTDPAALAKACDGAAALWLESPTNPTMEVVDLRRATADAHAGGAQVVVDNTFATPLLQQPLRLGADVVVHSASKFLAGHSDVILGVAVARDTQVVEALRTRRALGGAVAGPLDAFLALRGLRTLPVRLRQSQATALLLAERLATHPAVARVRYPGLPGDPGHTIATEQMDGYGAMLAFEHAGGAAAAEATCGRTRLWTHATSLGGVESTLERRRRWEFEPPSVPGPPGLPGDPGHAIATEQMDGYGAMLAFEHAGGAGAAEATCGRTRLWTHATSLGGVESTLERRRRWEFEPPSVPDALVRLSVGCEDAEDLWADLAQAL